MILGLSISGFGEVVGAFFCSVGSEEFANGGDESFDRSGCRFAQEVLKLGEDLLDRVQVGRLFRQKEELGARRLDRSANGFAFVTAEIVHDHQIARLERRDQRRLHIGLETLGVDRAVDEPWRFDAIVTKGGQEGHRLPMPVGNLRHEPFADRRPSPERLHVGLGPGLVDEDQALNVDLVLAALPLRSPPRHVGTVAFAGHDGFF